LSLIRIHLSSILIKCLLHPFSFGSLPLFLLLFFPLLLRPFICSS
jgi:hypothetical protein